MWNLKTCSLVFIPISSSRSQCVVEVLVSDFSFSTSSEGHIPTTGACAVHKQQKEAPHSPVRNNTVELKKDPINLRRRAKGKKQQIPVRNRRMKSKSTANQSDYMEDQYDVEGTYSCRFCKKEFGTSLGHKVHLRTHLKCSGCKKMFPYPSVLKGHIFYCDKVKLLKAKMQSTSPSQSQPDEENRAAPSEKQEHASLNKPSKKHGSSRMHCCTYCQKQFHTKSKLNGHLRTHTGETPFACRMCPKKFHAAQALKVHIQRIHKGQVDSAENNDGSSWTAPLDVTEDDQPLSPPPSDQPQQPVSTDSNSPPSANPASLESPGGKEKKQDRKSLLSEWHMMGTRCDEGYMCLVCQKITRSKYMLMEHFHIHTGEKPLECDRCPAKFRCRSQLSLHRRRCGTMIQCDKCEKEFSTKGKLKKHVQKNHKNWSHFCNICGKGFLIEGQLQNHEAPWQKGSVFWITCLMSLCFHFMVIHWLIAVLIFKKFIASGNCLSFFNCVIDWAFWCKDEIDFMPFVGPVSIVILTSVFCT